MTALLHTGSSLFLVLTIVFLAACAPSAPTVAPTKPAVAPVAATAAPAAAQATTVTAPTKPAAAAPSGPQPVFVAAPAAGTKIKRGGTIVVGQSNDPSSMDPIIDTSGWMQNEIMHIETLVDYSVTDLKAGNQEITPRLAESWKQVSPTEIVFNLRKGVKFHDGSDMTAEVVKWSLDRMKSAKSQAKHVAANIDQIEVVDPSTLRIKYKTPSGIQLVNLTVATAGTGCIGPAIISKAHVDKNGEAILDKLVVGTGPMKMVEWKRDDVTNMTRFDNYWKMGADGQKLPYLDGLKSRMIADNAVQIAELKAGGVHLTRSLAPSDLPTIKSNQELTYLDVSWSPHRWFFGFNREKNPFGSNQKLRVAAQYAIDRESIAKVMAPDAGSPNRFWGWIPAWVGYSETAMKEYKFDLDKASAAFKESGATANVPVALLHETPTQNRKVGEMVQAMLSKVGITVTLDAMEKTAARQRIVKGEFEMHVWSWAPSADPAHFNRAWTCEGSANWGHVCNPELDKCMFAGEQEMDPKKRAEIYQKCENILYEDAFQGGTFIRSNLITYRKEVKNFKMQIHSYDLSEAWLDK